MAGYDATEPLHLGLARRDYCRHPVLCAALLATEGARRLTAGSLRAALSNACTELKVEVCHREGVRGLHRLLSAHEDGRLRLNVGCGPNRRAGWLNVDLDSRADVRIDVRRPLPFADGSCVEIFSEHFVEHLAYPGEIEAVLRDWRRVLVPGGRVSVGVPETAAPLRAYVTNAPDYFDWCRTQPWNPTWIETRLDQINFHFRQQAFGFGHDHRYAYDVETLSARLTAAGFADISERPFDPASDSRPGTLWVEAKKSRD